jgi:hypothetical protein
MLRLGVRVLLLLVSPFFVSSFVAICMLFPAPAYDVVVTACVWTLGLFVYLFVFPLPLSLSPIQF